jgi:site-specific recombinase XerD
VDERVISLVKRGLANQRPAAAARYESTWDLDLLLEYWLTATATGLSRIRDKALSLLAAAAVARASDLERIRAVDFSDTGVVLHIYRAKNSVAWAQPINIGFLPPGLERCCAARALSDYIDATDTMRAGRSTLFLTLQPGKDGQYSAINAKSIAKRIQSVMLAAGVDPAFRPNSIRHAAVSHAVDAGASLEAVQLHGRWRSNSVFVQHYLRATPITTVSTDILTRHSQQ